MGTVSHWFSSPKKPKHTRGCPGGNFHVAMDSQDLDLGELGGTLTWVAPEVAQTVTAYKIYLAQDRASALGNVTGGRF